MSARKTVDLTTSLRPHPAFFNFASMFERTTWSGPLRLREPLRSGDRNQPDPRRRREAPRRRLPNMEAHRAREDRFVRSWFSAATSGRGINSLAIRRQDLFEFSGSRSESVGRSLMTNARKRRSLPGPEYRIKVAFRFSMDYVFAWCTHYTSDAGRLEREKDAH